MTTSPRLARPRATLPFGSEGALSVDVNNQATELIAGGAIPIQSRVLTTPPSSPTNGFMYIVPIGATGVWAPHVGKMVYWLADARPLVWQAATLWQGMIICVINEAGANFQWNGSAFGAYGAGGGGGSGDMVLASTQTNTGAKTFADGTLKLGGATSGASTLKAPAVAGSLVHTLPPATDTLAGVTDVAVAASAAAAALAAHVAASALVHGISNTADLVTLTGAQNLTNKTVPTPSGSTDIANKGYVDTAVTGLFDFKGATDCSSNPNYPVGLKGDAYVVSVAGKIGGASGKSVEIGDVYVASADNAGGTEASVGTSWFVLEHNLVGALLAANNLSDLNNVGTARTNLGLGAIALLASIATANIDVDAVTYARMQNISAQYKLLGRSSSGAGDPEEVPSSAAGFALLAAADVAAERVALGLSNSFIASAAGSFDGGGSAIPNGTTVYCAVPFAGTITGYTILVDTGTCTLKTWRKATGTAIPTVADSISTAGVSISSGTAIRSTTVSDFTSVAVAANDIFAFNITAISGATKIWFALEITKS